MMFVTRLSYLAWIVTSTVAIILGSPLAVGLGLAQPEGTASAASSRAIVANANDEPTVVAAVDIPVDESGMVRPGTGGMSVNDSPTGMPEYRRPPSFGGSGKDLNMYCISSCELGSGLRYVPDAGEHGFLEPAWEMPFEEYQGYLHGTAGSWSEVLP